MEVIMRASLKMGKYKEMVCFFLRMGKNTLETDKIPGWKDLEK
jgi:hypothetical protein